MSKDSTITKETVLKVAKLARIKIEDKDALPLALEMSGILTWINQLNAVNTDTAQPFASPIQEFVPSTPLRVDQINDGNYVQKILSNAPQVELDMFVVPKVVE